MKNVLLGLGFLLVVAVALVAGAGLHAWLDDATEVADFQHTDEPQLTVAQVRKLVWTFLWGQLSVSGEGILEVCLHDLEERAKELIGEERLSGFEFEYVGNKLWLVSNSACSIIVSDATGKVSAP